MRAKFVQFVQRVLVLYLVALVLLACLSMGE